MQLQQLFIGIEKMELNSLNAHLPINNKNRYHDHTGYFGFGTSGAVLGYTVAMVIAGFIGVALVWTQYKKLPKLSNVKLEIKAYTKPMLTYGVPLSLSAIISGFQASIYAFLLPIFYVTDNTAIGNFGIASTFVVLISLCLQRRLRRCSFQRLASSTRQKDKADSVECLSVLSQICLTVSWCRCRCLLCV